MSVKAQLIRRWAMYWALAFIPTCFIYLNFSQYTNHPSGLYFEFLQTPSPALGGKWGPKISTPLVPAAAALLPRSGHVLLFAADRGDVFHAEGGNSNSTSTAVYDPIAGTITAGKLADTDHGMFCPGLSLDSSGRAMVSGGVSDSKVSIYDDSSQHWRELQSMHTGRGYHSQVTLSNGNIFTIGGSWSGGVGGDDVPSKAGEVFDLVNQTWKPLPRCPVEPLLTNDSRGAFCSDNHAWLFAWKGESVFQAGPSSSMNWYGTNGQGVHHAAGRRAADLDSMNGNSVMYDALGGKILTLGGSTSYSNSYSTSAAHIITLSDAFGEVKVEEIEPMHFARAYANSVILPTGEVFINGGASYAKQWADVNASLVPEIWNPDTRKFTKLTESPTPRTYHSIAILLPDATVLTGGGGLCWINCVDPSVNHLDVQIFYPPYLFDFQHQDFATRPQISQVSSSSVQPGASLGITTDQPLVHFALIRHSSVTHSINTDQRRVALEAVRMEIVERDGQQLWLFEIIIPYDSGKVPPGYWMLFAINQQGVPSHAATIEIQVKHEKLNPAQSGNLSTSMPQSLSQEPDPSTVEDPNGPIAIHWFHPRLFATRTEWENLPTKIQTDDYMIAWDQHISQWSERVWAQDLIKYNLIGPLNGNGVLDTARELQLRIKHWSYMFRMTQNMKWKDRIWKELIVASGNSTEYFGVKGDNWNSQHWLDIGEFLVAFSFAYDWLYDAWMPEQREAIMWSMISLGLVKALEAYIDDDWFLHVRSNWNCVTNGGIIIAALAIYHEDPTGTAKLLLPRAIKNARDNCAQAVQNDGTWKETPDYWYFGTHAHAQLASALLSATGSTHGLLTANPAFRDTGMFHIYNNGFAGKFDYGDCGPEKFTATANSLLFYGDQYRRPAYTGYQRDKAEAADPLSMFWYQPKASDSVWKSELPLDRSFDDENGAWVSMRSTWTSNNGLFVAMKSGKLTGHSSHGNLDAGDFVLDALGERWVAQLCHQDYLSPGYFDGEGQDDKRWKYYRTSTAGQNTILYNGINQLVTAAPSTRFESTETAQYDSTTGLDTISTALWVTNLTSAYDGPQIQRGMRLTRNRTQVLIQDEIHGARYASQWRMHTRADIAIVDNGRRAILTLNDKKIDIIIHGSSEKVFRVMDATPPTGQLPLSGVEDLPNPSVQVLIIDINPGTHRLQVVFAPRWSQASELEFYEAPSIPLNEWNISSHGYT